MDQPASPRRPGPAGPAVVAGRSLGQSASEMGAGVARCGDQFASRVATLLWNRPAACSGRQPMRA